MGAITASTKLLIAFHVMSAYPILMNVLTTEIERGLGLNGPFLINIYTIILNRFPLVNCVFSMRIYSDKTVQKVNFGRKMRKSEIQFSQ